MDNLRGAFDSTESAEDNQDWDSVDEQDARDVPPDSIGQDERRMQVRAYNHWASLLGDRTYPGIEDLEPENLPDFGPYSVVLDFSDGIDDPAVQFLGGSLAEECGAEGDIGKLSDVPPRSLLSRITDHYMQILANQAPIGFEAEFVNQRGIEILYRGILLPFSSDDETIDFIYGVINWKEMADQVTADELLLEIDQALESEEEIEAEAAEPQKHSADPVTEWADSPAQDRDAAKEPVIASSEEDSEEPLDLGEFADVTPIGEAEEIAMPQTDTELDDLPMPNFGDYALDDFDEDEDEEGEEENGSYDFASLTDYIEAPAKKAQALDIDPSELENVDYGAGELDNSELSDEGFEQPSAEPAVEEPQHDEAVAGEPAVDEPVTPEPIVAETPIDAPVEFETVEEPVFEDAAGQNEPQPEPAPVAKTPIDLMGEFPEDADEELPEDAGLYDFLASARELAQTAHASEDRSRKALYAAVGRAYDFSLAAQDAPEDYNELVEENGLSVQERAPMTPVVKLVFGSDYDKTRLTEYAAVLSHAHRVGVERGELATFLRKADGGLKGVVKAERQLRREESGKEVEVKTGPREALAKKLRELDAMLIEALEADGPEFGLVMIRRNEEGVVEVLGEIEQDIPMIERAARKLVG